MADDIRFERERLHQQLLEIRAARGALTPQAVVDEARDVSHPLHERFEWDDAIAGEAFRRVQAARLIREVRIVYRETPEGDQRTVRAWSSTHSAADPEQRGYVPTEELALDDIGYQILLRQCERELRDFQRKYGHLKEFGQLMRGYWEAS